MSFGNSRGSTAMSVNIADFVMFPVYLIALLVLHGLMEFAWLPLDLAQEISLGGGHAISIAAIFALISLGYVAYSNDWSGNLSWVQAWIVAATVLLIVGPPLVPVFEGTLAATPAALIALAIQIGGYASFAYVG